MYRTHADRWLLDVTNRHCEMRRRQRLRAVRHGRRSWNQVLRALRVNVGEWLALEWMP